MVRMQIICKMSVNTTLSQQQISYSRIKVTSGLRTAFNSSPVRLSDVVLVLFWSKCAVKTLPNSISIIKSHWEKGMGCVQAGRQVKNGVLGDLGHLPLQYRLIDSPVV